MKAVLIMSTFSEVNPQSKYHKVKGVLVGGVFIVVYTTPLCGTISYYTWGTRKYYFKSAYVSNP